MPKSVGWLLARVTGVTVTLIMWQASPGGSMAVGRGSKDKSLSTHSLLRLRLSLDPMTFPPYSFCQSKTSGLPRNEGGTGQRKTPPPGGREAGSHHRVCGCRDGWRFQTALSSVYPKTSGQSLPGQSSRSQSSHQQRWIRVWSVPSIPVQLIRNWPKILR